MTRQFTQRCRLRPDGLSGLSRYIEFHYRWIWRYEQLAVPVWVSAAGSADFNMLYLILKAAVSGILIAIISEVARRYPSFGGLIASLPLVSLIAIIWLWNDSGGDRSLVSGHARATLWFVVPSLPFFLVLPALLERNVNFWLALLIASSITVILYLLAIWFAGRMGIDFK